MNDEFTTRQRQRGYLTTYLNGRVLKRWPYKLLND